MFVMLIMPVLTRIDPRLSDHSCCTSHIHIYNVRLPLAKGSSPMCYVSHTHVNIQIYSYMYIAWQYEFFTLALNPPGFNILKSRMVRYSGQEPMTGEQ